MRPRERAGWILIASGAALLACVNGIRAEHHYTQPPAITCQASQPVYTGTAITGTWHAALQPGDSVTLPDGDTYTCTARGAYVH
jgi:hypothetical protein